VGALLFTGLTLAQALLKTSSQDLFASIHELTVDYATVTQVGELTQALSTTVWGLGTGSNTGPARFAVTDSTAITLENYFAKAVMEFGVIGLVLIVLLLGATIWYAYRACRSTTHPRAKAYAHALAAFVIISVINEWKGSYLDIDPLNVYFWFFLGVLLRIPLLRSAAQQTRPAMQPSRIAPRCVVPQQWSA
jgi:O-antigen ligase